MLNKNVSLDQPEEIQLNETKLPSIVKKGDSQSISRQSSKTKASKPNFVLKVNPDNSLPHDYI